MATERKLGQERERLVEEVLWGKPHWVAGRFSTSRKGINSSKELRGRAVQEVMSLPQEVRSTCTDRVLGSTLSNHGALIWQRAHRNEAISRTDTCCRSGTGLIVVCGARHCSENSWSNSRDRWEKLSVYLLNSQHKNNSKKSSSLDIINGWY